MSGRLTCTVPLPGGRLRRQESARQLKQYRFGYLIETLFETPYFRDNHSTISSKLALREPFCNKLQHKILAIAAPSGVIGIERGTKS